MFQIRAGHATLAAIGAGALAVVAIPVAAAPQQINVKDVAGLQAAVINAAPGSTIRLAPGDYPNIDIKRQNNGARITITGPRSARFQKLQFIKPAQGWRVHGVSLLAGTPGVSPTNLPAVYIWRASDISFDNVLITGIADSPDAWGDNGKGLSLLASSGIVLANSEVRHVRLISGFQDSRGVVFVNNRFHDAREGLQISNSHGLLVRNNSFEGWTPRYDLGEHSDMIQFWTRNRPNGSSRVEIANNFLSAGLDRNVQGLFVRAEDHEKGKYPEGFHRNWVVRNNIYFGSSKHGITLGDVRGAIVENNTVLAAPHAFVGKVPVSADGRSSSGHMPHINLLRSTEAVMRNNLAPGFSLAETAIVENINNLQYRPRAPELALNPAGSFAAPLVAGQHKVDFFAIVPGSQAAQQGLGADVRTVGPQATPEPIAALEARARALADTADPYLLPLVARPRPPAPVPAPN